MFTIIDAPQRSDEWFKARLGRLTGSRADDMLTTIKNGESAARRNLRMRLVCERLTQVSLDDPMPFRTVQRGIDAEPRAIAAYEAQAGRLVRRTGFLRHETLMAGCSLDGDVGRLTGIIEVKCGQSTTHLECLKTRAVPKDYMAQVTHNLWISGAGWCDYVSFDDRFPASLALCVVRVARNVETITAYEQRALAFLEEVNKEEAGVRLLMEKVA
jgi:predicted phage-related endonuclease